MKRFRRVSRAALAFALAGGASLSAAQAPETQSQTNPAPAEAGAAAAAEQNNSSGGASPTTGVEEIVVTAQFREQNLQQTPIAITAVSGAMLEARSQTNISDVANQAPSVTLKPNSAAFGPSLSSSIRGVGQYDLNPALEPGVGLYVDDVYYATLTGSILDLLDLERVEILRGPQGTLAGKNSIGGAIKLYSKKPSGSNTGYVQATYGSRDRIDLRASADFKLMDNLFARLAGVSKKQDGYVKVYDFACLNPPGTALNPAVGGIQPVKSSGGSCLIDREGEVNYQAIRGQLRFDNGGPVEVNLIADYTNDDRSQTGTVLVAGTNAPGAPPAPTNTSVYNPDPQVRGNAFNVPYDNRFICGRFCNYSTFFSPAGPWLGPVATGYPLVETRGDGRSKFEGWGVSGQIDLKLAEKLKLVSITAYRAYNTSFTNDDDLSPLAVANGFSHLTFWSVSQELRLNGSFGADDFVNYTLGGFYQDQKSIYETFQDLRYPAIPLQFRGNDPVNADTKAVFAQVTVNATDKLSLVGGLRYSKEHKDYTFVRLNRDGTVNPFLGALNGQTGVFNGSRVDYRGSLQYQFTDGIMGYAQVSTGFKGGGIGPRPFNVAQVRSFGPEKLTAYEVGVKSDLFDRLARLNVAAFYSDYKDIQLTLLSCPQFGGPGPCALPQNAGDARIQGIEVELSLRPAQGFSIDGALSYVDFKYKSINPLAGGPTNPAGVQLDDVPPYTPKWKWSFGVQYEIDLGNSGSITPRFDAAYQSHIFSGATNTNLERIGAYTIANARLTWRNSDNDLEISGEVTNLFDKYYYLTAFDLTGAGSGGASNQPGRPREWALTVKKKF